MNQVGQVKKIQKYKEQKQNWKSLKHSQPVLFIIQSMVLLQSMTVATSPGLCIHQSCIVDFFIKRAIVVVTAINKHIDTVWFILVIEG